MRNLNIIFILLAAIIGFTVFTDVCQAADYYVTQNATGSNSGSDCANAYSASWFNTAGNWGGAGKINPGDTVHLCGTFTGAAGSNMLTFQGSGTAGNVITVRFESGAIMQAPYWGQQGYGAIGATNKSYIKIDGGTNGIIQNTDNGSTASGKTYHSYSYGIFMSGCSNVEIANLTIKNLFINTGGNSSGSSDTSGAGVFSIRFEGPPYSNIYVHDNTLSNARGQVYINVDSTSTSSNINIYNNTISDNCWGIVAGGGSQNISAIGINVYNNNITNWTLWQWPTATYHTDGIIIYADGSGSNISGNVFNNYIYGDLGGGSPTAFIFLESNTKNFNVYNNLLVGSGQSWVEMWLGGDICTGGGHNIYNNTLVGGSSNNSAGSLVKMCSTGITFKNNIFSNASAGIMERPNNYSGIIASDYNIFNTGYPIGDNDIAGPAAFLTLSQWQSSYSQDLHSMTGNPLFVGSSNYQLQSGSPAIGKATNLTSLNINSLNYDKINVARPSLGAWDIGAYAFSSATIQSVPTPKPSPPVLRLN